MKKFEGGLNHSGFLAIKDQLIIDLSAAFKAKLIEMGPDAQGISWFSSNAEKFVREKQLRAA